MKKSTLKHVLIQESINVIKNSIDRENEAISILKELGISKEEFLKYFQENQTWNDGTEAPNGIMINGKEGSDPDFGEYDRLKAKQERTDKPLSYGLTHPKQVIEALKNDPKNVANLLKKSISQETDLFKKGVGSESPSNKNDKDALMYKAGDMAGKGIKGIEDGAKFTKDFYSGIAKSHPDATKYALGGLAGAASLPLLYALYKKLTAKKSK